jgi:hypothetical protein
MNRFSSLLGSVLLATLACNGGTEPHSRSEFAGIYFAVGGTGVVAHGVLTSTVLATGAVTDQLAEGASITLELNDDGTTTGHVYVPDPDAEDLNADLTGNWTLAGTTITLEHTADTFLKDMSFEATGDALVAERTFQNGELRVTVRLERVTQ